MTAATLLKLKKYGIRAMIAREAIVRTEQDFIKAIKAGKIFVYPTDTVYGIGCNALNRKAVARIYGIKKRARGKPLSVIAPSKKWILENFAVKNQELNKYLPGPYTLILPKKKKSFLSAVSKGRTVGVRIPDCALTELIQRSQLPFITTSANVSGKKAAANLIEIDFEVLNAADIIIDGGKLAGKPSTILDLVSGKFITRKK